MTTIEGLGERSVMERRGVVRWRSRHRTGRTVPSPMADPEDRSAAPRWQRIGLRTAVAVLALGAIALRFRTDSPLWLDEALTVHIADLPLGDIGPALRHDGHPPLYYWLLHVWID